MKKQLILSIAMVAIASFSVNAQDCAQGCQGSKSAMTSAVAVQQEEAAQEVEAMDIVDTAAGAEAFGTLVAAVKAAELVDVLKGEGPFTVFAPTNEAFAKLPEGTVESLLLPENREKLVAILKYHVVSGKVMAGDVVKLESAETVLGKNVTIAVEDGTVMINNATVVKTDIGCTNGVIHVIDTVIIPSDE